jgi:hypothetical protein
MKQCMTTLCILGMLALGGCATMTGSTGSTAPTWDQIATTDYEVAGSGILAAKSGLDVLCKPTPVVLTAGDCLKAYVIYGKVQASYDTAGKALVVAIKESDVVKKQGYMAAFTAGMGEVGPMVSQIVALVATFKGEPAVSK